MRLYQKVGLALSIVVGLPLMALSAYAGLVFYDIHRVRELCPKLVPGTSVAAATNIVEDAGLGDWVKPIASSNVPGIFDEKTKTWFFAVPAATTMGDIGCGVTHDGHVVIAAQNLEW